MRVQAYASTVFLPIPDADYVYCRNGAGLPLASTAFVRHCQAVWEVVYTAKSWGEFVDRLDAFDSGLREYVMGDPEEYFSELTGAKRGDPFSGADAVADLGLPIASGDREPYRSWDGDMPEEIYDLADSGSTMVSSYCTLDVDTLPAALEIIRRRGESAVEDCELLDELTWLGGDWPPLQRREADS